MVNDFANEVYLYRVSNRLSQTELAERCNVSFVTISNIETGKHKPTKITEKKIRMVINADSETDGIKEKMIRYRAKHDISQRDFAKLCGIAVQTVYSIEKGEQMPKAKVLGKILSIIEEE